MRLAHLHAFGWNAPLRLLAIQHEFRPFRSSKFRGATKTYGASFYAAAIAG
jgi:hypothetical protein